MRRFFDRIVPAGQRFEALDGVRGLAALSVMVGHLGYFFLPAFHTLGGALTAPAVSVFFALSAFLLYYPVAAGKRFDVRRYLLRRAVRIYPAYLLALAVSVFLLTFAGRPAPLPWLVPHLFFVQTLRDDWAGAFDGPTWSLVTEVQFYLLLPVLIVLLRRRWVLPAVAVGSLAMQAARWPDAIHWTRWWDFPQLLLCFLAGIVVAQLTARGVRWRWAGVLGFGALIAHVVAGAVFQWPLWAHTAVGSRSLPVTIAIALALLSCTTGAGSPLLRWRPLRLCGLCGYGIFLLHVPFAVVAGIFQAPPHVAAVVPVATMIGALASYLLVERPALGWLDRKLHRTSAGPVVEPATKAAAAS